MSDEKEKPAKKEADKPTFLPHQSIFEQRTGQKAAHGSKVIIGDMPHDVQEVMKIVNDLQRVLKK